MSDSRPEGHESMNKALRQPRPNTFVVVAPPPEQTAASKKMNTLLRQAAGRE